MIDFLVAIVVVIAVIAFMLAIQGVVTQLATWLVTGSRPALATVVRANLLAGIGFIAALIFMLFFLPFLLAADDYSLLILCAMIAIPLVIMVWIFADILDISIVQAIMVVVLVNIVNMGVAWMATPFVPELPADIPISKDLRQFI